MADDDHRVAVYIDFDNVVISRYNQLHGRAAFQSDGVRNVVEGDPRTDAGVADRIRAATVDIGAILDYASSFGTIVVSRAYADWSQPVNAGYRRQLIDRAVDLTQMFPLSATKNGADIRLAIDVVEDLFRLDDVTHVVLVAGDSDYVALAQRAKRLGRFFVAVGVAGATSRSLPAACNDFSLYDDLPGIGTDDPDADAADAASDAAGNPAEAAPAASDPATEPRAEVETPVEKKRSGRRRAAPRSDAVAAGPASGGDAVTAMPTPASASDPSPEPTAEPAAKMSARAATTLLRRALELAHDKAGDDEWLNASAVKGQIKRMDPAFHEKSLGYKSFTDFLRSRSSVAELDRTANGQLVRLRQQSAG